MIVAAAVRINHCVCSMQAPARQEALIHARECGQVLKRKPGVGYQGDELFSEDLW